MDFNVGNVEKAVNLFYNSDSFEQKHVHEWLNDLQNSPQAWSIVWDILSTPRSSQVHFFAASTLHLKLMRNWDEIPEPEYGNFKENMLKLIVKFATGPKIVLNRLCIAFASFIIHTITSFWKTAFEDLVYSFQPQNLPQLQPERVICILLEILNVIPEEFKTTLLPAQTRKDSLTALISAVRDINKFSLMCIQPSPNAGFTNANTSVYLWATRCIYNWIQLGSLNVEECQTISEVLTDLICFIYWNRSDPDGLTTEETDLIEMCSDVFIVILQRPNVHKHRNLIMKICIDFLYKCRKILEVEGSKEDFNEDMLLRLYDVITSLADGHTKIFLNNLLSEDKDEQKLSCDLFKCVLDCVNLPGVYSVHENISNLSFGTLYTIQEEVTSFEVSGYAKLLLLIKPFYRSLVYILLRKGEYPLNETNWSEDDRDAFRCYRTDISDTFLYCYNVLNLELIDMLYTRLTEILKKKDYQWNELEACLHAVSSVAECTESENLYLPRLMVTIKDIPFDTLNSKVLSTAITAIGNYSGLISENHEVLEYTLPLVIKALENPDISLTATMALKDITNSCQKFMLPYSEPILNQIQKVLTMGILKMPANRRLFACMGRVLSVLPLPRAMDYLNIVLAPYFDEFHKELLDDSLSVRISILTKLKILGALYGSMSVLEENEKMEGPQPLLVIMQNTMQVYEVIGEKYCKDLAVIEDLSLVLKSAITSLMEFSKPIVNDVLQIVTSIFKLNPQNSVLIVAKTIFIIFCKDQDTNTIIHHSLAEIVNITLSMCSQYQNENSLSEKADVLEGFFLLLSSLLKKLPQYIFFGGCINPISIFQCGIMALVLPEQQLLKACSSFLSNMIIQSVDCGHSQIIESIGESLMLRMLLSIGTTTPRQNIGYFADIFQALNKKCNQHFHKWLCQFLSQDNFPSPKISSKDKEKFIELVVAPSMSKKKMTDTLLEFSLISKGIITSDALRSFQ
ncbi:importin-13 [Coccinella septempunctata]|uniref:importin-13 n=1 Tax=Coccinella septempunctata TaxID=41139 RepID=UPI001D096A69|nr:importin-13 [Coccinella septempunctata]